MENENKICFSVILPVYNQASFVRRAIKSVLAQTYDEWELIIVNDGCTDHTADFVMSFWTIRELNILPILRTKV